MSKDHNYESGDYSLKKSIVNLHISRKRTLSIIASFSLISTMICFFVILSVRNNTKQLYSLYKSEYLYSALVDNSNEPNSYLVFNAGINFATKADSKTGMNTDVIMQTADSSYTKLVSWNTEKMKEDEVAITAGIAKSYGLKEGDFVYSKNVVDGSIHDYLISHILLDATSARKRTGIGTTDGIIIMGYDSNYANNVKHNTLLFTNSDINLLSEKSAGTLTDILYREDEIIDECCKIFPYYSILVILSIALTLSIAIYLKKSAKCSFKRLITLGFDKRGLNRSLFALIFRTGIVSIVLSIFLCLIICGMLGLNTVEFLLLLSVIIIECITLTIAEAIIKRQLWRQ